MTTACNDEGPNSYDKNNKIPRKHESRASAGQLSVASSSTSIASRPVLVMRRAIAPLSSRRQTGSELPARTSSSRPARINRYHREIDPVGSERRQRFN
jgi:hypothetical protein